MSDHAYSEQYVSQLVTLCGSELTEMATAPPRRAYLAHSDDAFVPYIRLQEGKSERPVLYVPGFTEGIVAKLPFAVALANQGFDVTLPDQSRKKIVTNVATGRRDATHSQALNYLAVIEAEELDASGPVDIVTHSYGSLVLSAMVRHATANNQSWFKGSNVVMLAPAGLVTEKPLNLAKRWLQMMRDENRTAKDFTDPRREMFKAVLLNSLTNLPRTLREVGDLMQQPLNPLLMLQAGIGSLAVVSYAEDPLYGEDVLSQSMPELMAGGITWSVPYSLQTLPSGKLRGGKDASHNDEQFNPSRAAGAVAQILRSV